MTNKKDYLRNPNNGFFQDVILRAKLILRLMVDNRVNIFLKLLPVGALVYLVSPIDFLPAAVLPVIGAVDDVAVLWLGLGLFVSLCPDSVVQEHMEDLQKGIHGYWNDADEDSDGEEVIDVEAQEIPE